MSKRRRYKPEEKLAAVLEYVNGNKSYTEAGKVVGVDSWTVRDWVFWYKLEGAETFFSKGKNKQYPEELRKAAVMDYQAGTGSLRGICSKYKIREKYLFFAVWKLGNTYSIPPISKLSLEPKSLAVSSCRFHQSFPKKYS